MVNKTPTPIFVLGKQRSGTTWLANQLAKHPAIAAISHAAHEGVHESVYFSHIYNKFGNLHKKKNCESFIEIFGNSDYAFLAGVTPQKLRTMFPSTYAAVFRKVMDEVATKQGAAYWLEKSPAHTPLLPLLARLYPDAVFIGITRDITEVIASTLKMAINSKGELNPLTRKARLIQNVFLKIYYDRVMYDFACSSKRIMLVSFSEFKADQESVLRNLCAFLNLEYVDGLLVSQYQKNTSFKSDKERQRIMTKAEVNFCRWAEKIINTAVPFWLMNFVYNAVKKPNKKKRLPAWFFKLRQADSPYGNV